MSVDERAQLGDHIIPGLLQVLSEARLVVRGELGDRREENLELVLEVVVDEPRRNVRFLRDVRHRRSVIAALGHHMQQRPRDLRLSFVGVCRATHRCLSLVGCTTKL